MIELLLVMSVSLLPKNWDCGISDIMKKIKVYILEKKHSINGNPIYTVFIPDVTGKQKGLRKLKKSHMYSLSSYNLQHSLAYCFPNNTVEIIRE